MLDAALELAGRGFRVFPLAEGMKTPITAHGCKDATTAVGPIGAWWSSRPNSNVGIATGVGLVVIDIDLAGHKQIDAAIELDIDDNPYVVYTPRGGAHYYFETEAAGICIPNSASTLMSGVDVRGEGGYVVAPPSVLADGRGYEWGARAVARNAPPRWDEIPILPRDLAKRLRRAPEVQRTLARPARPGFGPLHRPSWLDDELEKVRAAPEGQRNHTLNAISYSLGKACAKGKVRSAETIDDLIDAGVASGMAQREVVRTVQSGFSAGLCA